VCEIMRSKGLRCVKRANIFFSHAQMEMVRRTLSGMESYAFRSERDIATLIFWCDYFTLKQNVSGEFKTDQVEEIIRVINHTVMLTSPWNNPTTLTRAWCVYEVICADKVNAVFETQLAPEDQSSFVAAIEEDYENLMTAFVNLDIQKCTATKPEDKDKVLQQVSQLAGGLQGANARVIEALKTSFLPTLLHTAKEQPNNHKFLHEVALIFHRVSADYPMAEDLYRKALGIREKVLRPEHFDVGTSCNDLGLLLQDKGDLVNAEKLIRRALGIAEKAYGLEHPDFATSCANLGLFL